MGLLDTPPRLLPKITTPGLWTEWTPTGIYATNSGRQVIGDPGRCNGFFFAISGSNLYRATDPSIATGSWTACSLPASVSSGSKLTDIVYFKGKYFVQGVEDSGTGNMAVWVSDPPVGAANMSWAKVLDGAAGSGSYRGTLAVFRDAAANTGTDVALLAGEYADPSSTGPRVYRCTAVPASSSDWMTVSPFPIALANMRHVHAIEPDDHTGSTPGSGMLTAGDGVTRTVMKTTDSGATWTDDQTDSNWQAVQVSNTPNYTYFASDSSRGTFHRRRRSDGRYEWPCPDRHINAYIEPEHYKDGVVAADGTTITSAALVAMHLNELAYSSVDNGTEVRGDATVITAGTTISSVVGATGVITLSQPTPAGAFSATGRKFTVMRSHRHKWKQNAFFGKAWVDSTTGRDCYVCVAGNDQEGGDHYGLFFWTEGMDHLHLLSNLWGNSSAFGRVFIYGGFIYFGTVIYPLPALAA